MKVYKTTESEILSSFYRNLNKKSSITKRASALGAAIRNSGDIASALGRWHIFQNADAATKPAIQNLLNGVNNRSIKTMGELVEQLEGIRTGLSKDIVAHVIHEAQPGTGQFADALELYAAIATKNNLGWDEGLRASINGLTDATAKYNYFSELTPAIKEGFLSGSTADDLTRLVAGAGTDVNAARDILKLANTANAPGLREFLNSGSNLNVVADFLRSVPTARGFITETTQAALRSAGLEMARGIPIPTNATRQAIDRALSADPAIQATFREGTKAIDEISAEISKIDELVPILNKLKAGESLTDLELQKLKDFDPTKIDGLAQAAQRSMSNLDSALAGSPEAQRVFRLLDEYKYAVDGASKSAAEARNLRGILDGFSSLNPGVVPTPAMRNAAVAAVNSRRLIETFDTGPGARILNQARNLWDSANSNQIAAFFTKATGSPEFGRLISATGPVGRMATQLIFNKRMFATSLLGTGSYGAITNLYSMFYSMTGRTLIDKESLEGIRESEKKALQQLKIIKFENQVRETLRNELIQALETSITSIESGIGVLNRIESVEVGDLVLGDSEKSQIDKMFADLNNLQEKLMVYNRRIYQLENADTSSKSNLENESMLSAYEQSKTENNELLEKILKFFTDFAENMEMLEGIIPPDMMARLQDAINAGDPNLIMDVITDIESGDPQDEDTDPDVAGREQDDAGRNRAVEEPEEDVDEVNVRRPPSPSGSRFTESLREQAGTGGRRGQTGRPGAWTDGMYLFDTLFDISSMNPRFKANLIPMLKGVVSTPEGLAYIDPNFGSSRFGGNYMKAIESLYRSGAKTKGEIIDLIKEEAGFYGGGTRRDVGRAVRKYKERLKYYKQNQNFWSSQIQDDIQDYLADRAELESDQEVLQSEGSLKPKNEYIIKNSSYNILNSYLEDLKRL